MFSQGFPIVFHGRNRQANAWHEAVACGSRAASEAMAGDSRAKEAPGKIWWGETSWMGRGTIYAYYMFIYVLTVLMYVYMLFSIL